MKKYWIWIVVVAVAIIGVIVFIVIKKKQALPNKADTVQNVAASKPNFSKEDLQLMFDSWAANGYPGTFEDFITN